MTNRKDPMQITVQDGALTISIGVETLAENVEKWISAREAAGKVLSADQLAHDIAAYANAGRERVAASFRSSPAEIDPNGLLPFVAIFDGALEQMIFDPSNHLESVVIYEDEDEDA